MSQRPPNDPSVPRCHLLLLLTGDCSPDSYPIGYLSFTSKCLCALLPRPFASGFSEMFRDVHLQPFLELRVSCERHHMLELMAAVTFSICL